MEIEFDPAKDVTNRAKHGVSLALGRTILMGAIATLVDPRHVQEERLISLGLVAGRLFVCVHTRRGERMRIISVRKANRKEQEQWLGAP